MLAASWYLILGILLLALAVGNALIRRLPLTTAILYLAIGYALGPQGGQMFHLHPIEDSALLERLTEIAVIISLFSAGLKLRVPLRDPLWREPIRLAFVSMTLTVALIALAGTTLLGLPLGAAILLGAVLAPTDPVLASDVQVSNPGDRDRLRFSLTGEAGMNDGTAFPFVMLGLGLLGVHEIGVWGWRWVAVDVVWAIGGGLAVGGLLGAAVARFLHRVQREGRELLVPDEFLAIGVIALSYGAAILLRTYGFLAVFAAGLAMRGAGEVGAPEGGIDGEGPRGEVRSPHGVLQFNERLERIAEVGVVILLGGMLSVEYLPLGLVWFAPFLFLAVRPAAVAVGLLRERMPRYRRWLMSWFGIRGIGSLYYLTFALENGLPEEEGAKIAALVLSMVAISVIVHGITVTPLMNWWERKR